MKNILVFKTSVERESDVKKITPLLNDLMTHNDKWNFDLEDCDKILRVESDGLKSSVIEYALQEVGYQCSELQD